MHGAMGIQVPGSGANSRSRKSPWASLDGSRDGRSRASRPQCSDPNLSSLEHDQLSASRRGMRGKSRSLLSHPTRQRLGLPASTGPERANPFFSCSGRETDSDGDGTLQVTPLRCRLGGQYMLVLLLSCGAQSEGGQPFVQSRGCRGRMCCRQPALT